MLLMGLNIIYYRELALWCYRVIFYSLPQLIL